ncbi:MAG: hypothetical protein Kow0063_34730 [Anaerolineae bacterium]
MSTPLSLNDPFTLFLFVTATILMIGYGVGRWTNQRRARKISDWLEPGLRSLGGTPTVRKVNRSAFRFQVTNARRPFQTVTTSVVLISREFLPAWLWERIKGRDDLLVVHVTFRQPPKLAGEIVDPGNELGWRGEAQAQELGWAGAQFPPRWRLYAAPDTPISRLETMADILESSPFVLWRTALRQEAPHMLLSMSMPDLDGTQSQQLAHLLKKLSNVANAPSEMEGGGR